MTSSGLRSYLGDGVVYFRSLSGLKVVCRVRISAVSGDCGMPHTEKAGIGERVAILKTLNSRGPG
jgi:hypothetical protein